MLLYCNRSYMRIMLRWKGSIVLRGDCLVVGLILSFLSSFVQFLIDSPHILGKYTPQVPHHYGIHAIGVIVAFAVVFRTNLGWQRYWEAVTQLHFMYSKWGDAYSQLHAFIAVTLEQARSKGGNEADAKIDRLTTSLSKFQKYFSILSAVAADRLMHGDTQRMEVRASLVDFHKQIALRKEIRKEDLTGAKRMPKFELRHSGTQELGEKWEMSYVVSGHPTEMEEQAMKNSSDRPNTVMYMLLHELAKVSGDLNIAPPIQSRMYQELSNGMIGYCNCMKIADVPFPFAYAQLLCYILIIYSCLLPFYVVIFTNSYSLSAILTFLIFEGIWGVNEVAKELENPFGHDMNDIPMADFHARFIETMEDIDVTHQAATPDESFRMPSLKVNRFSGFSHGSNSRGTKSGQNLGAIAEDETGNLPFVGVQSNLSQTSTSSIPAPFDASASPAESPRESSPPRCQEDLAFSPRSPLKSSGKWEPLTENFPVDIKPKTAIKTIGASDLKPPVAVIGSEHSRPSDVGNAQAMGRLVEVIDKHLREMSVNFEKHMAHMSHEVEAQLWRI